MKKNRFAAQLVAGLLLAVATLSLTACANIIYHEPAYPPAGRTIPPSGLLQRVLAAYIANGSQGSLQVIDGLRDRRNNVQNTIQAFPISGYSASSPFHIINYPEEQRGYVLAQDGSLGGVDYGKESGTGSVANFGAYAPSAAVAPNGSRIAGAIPQAGVLEVIASGGTYALNLPNVDKVVINQGNSIILAMVRNSDTLYRVIRLPQSSNPVAPSFAVDCQPLQVPVYCVVPVGNTNSAGVKGAAYDRPSDAYFSVDGNTVDILNCGPECGGKTAGVTVLQAGPLQVEQVPTSDPLAAATPLASLPVANPVAIPGGVTAALSDGTNLYLAGQSLQSAPGISSPVFGGNLTVLPLTTYVPASPISISDGTHTRMLFADDNTLWIGSSQCASGVRAATAASELAKQGHTDQAGNYNCLTRFDLGTRAATIIPSVVQSTSNTPAAVTVGYPNTDGNLYYYGNLTGICWVQTYHKVYSAYGGQIHAFNTADGSEIDNSLITLQGTVLDVAYMDATTNAAN